MIEARAISHLGIAVRSIAGARPFYEATLGGQFGGVEEVPDQKVRVAMFLVGPPEHEVRIELLEATSPDSPIATFIERRGEGLHHVAFAVNGLDQILGRLKAAGVRLVDETARPGAGHSRIAFIHPSSSHGVLVELCETAGEPGDPGTHATPSWPG